jgi:DNA repair protein RecO (recombination protein O)
MLQKSRGIVLRLIPYSDRQKIVRVFTEDFGSRSMVFGTGGKTGKAMLSLLQPLQACDLVFFMKPEGLDSLRQTQASFVYQRLFSEPLKRMQAMFMSEVLYRCLHHHGEDPDLFQFVFDSLKAFDEEPQMHADYHLYWLLSLSAKLGFYPENNFSETSCRFNPVEGHFTSALSLQSQQTLPLFESRCMHQLLNHEPLAPMSREQRNAVLEGILALYAAHVPSWQELKSLEVLREISL